MSDGVGRREFLAAGAAIAAAGLAGCGEAGPPKDWHDAGPLAHLEADGFRARDITTVPEEAFGQAIRQTAYLRRGQAGEPAVVAFSARCTHLGCPTRYVESSRKFICPCHGGVFDFRGRVDGGPPTRPLGRWEATVHRGTVYLAPFPPR